jgi:hypothetical protein
MSRAGVYDFGAAFFWVAHALHLESGDSERELVMSVETPPVGRKLDVYFCSTAASALALASARAVL